MGITVAVKVEHLPIANLLVAAPASEKPRTVLVPNLDYHGSVRATLIAFMSKNVFLPEECQLLSAPLFTRLSEKDSVDDIYKRYSCQADQEVSEVHLDEETFTMYGREGGRFVDLVGERKIDEYHILDRSTLHLKRLPCPLSENGGRVFVETKDGILPLLGVSPLTSISAIKHLLEGLTGISVSQQLLSSVGRVMHDDFLVRDFDGLHKVYEDSIIDLCKSGDSNTEQAHRRMVVHVNVVGEEEFSIAVQGRDSVLSVLRSVESRIGIAPWQQKISYSGQLLQEKKTLGSYFIQPESVLTVTLSKSLADRIAKPSFGSEIKAGHPRECSGQKLEVTKLKLMRTSKGHVKGTLTIPVIATDTVSDLKRKLKRTLAPLMERKTCVGPAVMPQPFGDTTMRTPGRSPLRTPPSSHFSDGYDHMGKFKVTDEVHQGSEDLRNTEDRKLSSESKNVGVRSLSFSKLIHLKPSHQPTLHAPQHCVVEAATSPMSPGTSPSPCGKLVEEFSVRRMAPPAAKNPNSTSNGEAPSGLVSVCDLTMLLRVAGSSSTDNMGLCLQNETSCRDLMPELLSLPDLDPNEAPNELKVERKPSSLFADENNSTGGRFGNVQSKIDNKLGAIKNIDKKAVKHWFNTNMESFKEHIRVLADG